MKTSIVKLSEILSHPTQRMDANYHIGKAQGKKAYKVKDKGELIEDDISGKIMLTETEAKMYNETKYTINELTEKLSSILPKK